MLTTVEVPELLEEQYEANKQLARKIADALAGMGEERVLEADLNLLAWEEPAYVYVRGTAYFKFYHSERLLRMYSAGDFIPAGPRFPGAEAKISCDFAADVVYYPAGELMERLNETSGLPAEWMQYQESELAIMYGLCAVYMKPERKPDIRLKRFETGDVIISEGEDSADVFCLIDGSAEVKSRNVKVGEIRPLEFFGEIGFLLNQHRIASVIATSTCTVQIVDAEEFVELIKHNPQAIISLATTLARRIVELNERVVSG